MSDDDRMQGSYGNQLNRDYEKDDENFLKVELTKYEIDRQKRAIAKRKEQIVSDGGVLGVKLKGSSFTSTPSEIEFKDFTVLKPEIEKILLTNVSNGANYFKILPIEDEFRDYFEVFYVPPGKMSAGIACKITIKFTPQLNQNISTHLPILTGTGLMNIPIECTYSKAVVVAKNNIIDFGDVLYGEDKELKIQLVNEGALETNGKITDAYGRVLKDKTEGIFSKQQSAISESKTELGPEDLQENEEAELFQELKFSKIFKIEGKSALDISIKYVPKKKKDWATSIELTFEKFMHSPPIRIELRGRCVDLPISVEQPVYDMEICLLNNTYREQLVFSNSGSTAMKGQVVIPRETKQFIQLNPSFGYIQAKDKLRVWIKVVLLPEFHQMCQKYRKSEGEYSIPMQLVCSDQRLPVDFTLRIRVTTDKIVINPKIVDFELLYQDTAKKVNITFQNTCSLPQFIYFYPLPKSVTYEPGEIPLAILPNEKVDVGFIYRAFEVRKEEDFIRAKIVTGNISVQQIKIPYKSSVIKCPLKFSSLKIEFQSLQIGEKGSHLLMIKNMVSRDYICEIFLPPFEVCGLRIAPLVFVISKGRAVEVNIDYYSIMKKLEFDTLKEIELKEKSDPEKNFELKKQIMESTILKETIKIEPEDDKKKKGTEKKPAPVAEKKKTKKELEEEEAQRKKEEEERLIREEEERKLKKKLEEQFDHDGELLKLGGKLKEFKVNDFHSQHYNWLIPVYFRPKDDPETSRSAMYIEVSTVTTSKLLLSDKEEIDFGEVAVGFRKVEELLITNTGDTDADLHLDLLPLLDGFTVLNALKVVPPGKTRNVVVQFEPYNQSDFNKGEMKTLFNNQGASEKYKQTLTIYSGKSCVSVRLKGTSVKPEVALSPEDGLLSMGGTLPGERIEKSFEIKNVSSFALDFKLDQLKSGLQRTDGQDSFLFLPSQGNLKAGETLTVKVIFCPDRISEKYFSLIKIDVPNQKVERMLFIKAACYPRQAYVCYYQPMEFPKSQELNQSIENPLDFIRVKDSSLIIGCEKKIMQLDFPKVMDRLSTSKDSPLFEKRIVIGNCKLGDPKLEKQANFELSLLKDENSEYFVLENAKGTVAAGGTQQIKIRFKPAEPDPFIADIKAFKGIGQWIEVKGDLKISGGYVQTGSEDAVVITVRLKAYIEKI